MKTPELFNEDHRATYCPEDDKLRLYVGRVPRPEYDALRAEGWQATAKQDCDFSAVWTVSRKETAESYAGIIEDEDAGPAERAADRADRFGGYRDKRLDKATGHADRYDAGPAVHGYQSQARGERAAARHDRRAGLAVNSWDKADYWTSRTAGVISHALHLSSPAVRMGRIKTIEADLRKAEADWKKSTEAAQARFDSILSIVEHAEGTREKITPSAVADFRWELSKIREAEGTGDEDKSTPEQIRRAVLVSNFSGYSESEANKRRATEARGGSRPAADIAREWLEGRTRPADWDAETGSEYTRHLKLRLAYEWQMLEAQGGRESLTEMERGGTLGGKVIAKVNKSPKTGRVVSVAVVGPGTGERWTYGATNEPGTPFALYQFDTERLAPGAYAPPTDESRAKLAEFDAARKAAAAKVPKAPSLINPTIEDAERLQALINAEYLATWTRQHGTAGNYYKPKDPGNVCQVTQAEYSAASGGAYSKAETRQLCAMGAFDDGYRSNANSRARAFRIGPVLCKIRTTGHEPVRVVHITDKPAKPLPASVWQAYTPPVSPETLKPRARELVAIMAKVNGKPDSATPEEKALLADAERVGLVNLETWRPAWRDEGVAWARAAGAFEPATAKA